MTHDAQRVSTRLEALSRAVHPQERGPYSNAAVAEAMNTGVAFSGGVFSPAPIAAVQVAALRDGGSDVIATEQRHDLASCFGVGSRYLVSDSAADICATEIHEELQLLESLRDAGVAYDDVKHVSREAGR